MIAKPHSGLSDKDYHALVNAVTSRFDCDRVGRGLVDREGLRAEFDAILGGLLEQFGVLHEAATQAWALLPSQYQAAEVLAEALLKVSNPASERIAGWSPEVHAAELASNQESES